jgi:hypothetical protein
LKLDPALFGIGRLLDRNHLSLHLGQFSRRLFIADAG